MIKLIIEDDEGKTTVVPIIRDEIFIGRKEGNTIRLTERNVSRRHAKILRQNGAVSIEDLESYNGIKVNGNKINGRVALAEGDRVQIGDYVLALKVDASISEETAADTAVDATDDAPTERIETKPSSSTTAPTREMRKLPEYGRIVCVSSNFPGLEFTLNKADLVIGRTDDNEIVINHRSISRHHARISVEQSRFTITDLQSANGLRVNGEEYSKVELRRGDLVDLGHVRLRFVAPGEDFVFSRDATIVDVSQLEKRGRTGWWAAIAVIAIIGVGSAYWLARRQGYIGEAGQLTAADSTALPVSQALQTKANAQSERIAAALGAQAWSDAVEQCTQLGNTVPEQSRQDCLQARKELQAQKVYEDARRAAAALEYKQALELYAQIPTDSVYRKKADNEPEYKEALSKYLSQALQELDALIKQNHCPEAKTLAIEIDRMAPQQTEAVTRAEQCAVRVAAPSRAAGTTKPRHNTTTGDSPDNGTATTDTTTTPSETEPVKPKTRNKPPKRTDDATEGNNATESTTATSTTGAASPSADEAIKQALADAQKAYIAGQHAQAITFAKTVLKQHPDNSQALQIVGASSCYLKNAKQALKAYEQLDATRKNLLRSVCARNDVILPQ